MRRDTLNFSNSPGAPGWTPRTPAVIPAPTFSDLQSGVWLHTRVPEILPILIDFIADADDVKGGLARFAERHIAPAALATERLPEICTSLLLSPAGYHALGFSVQPFAEEAHGIAAMPGWGGGDSPAPSDSTPHGVVLLSAASRVDLTGLVPALLEQFDGLARACLLQPFTTRAQDETDPALDVEYQSIVMNLIIPRRPGPSRVRGRKFHDLDDLCLSSLIPDPYADGPASCGCYFVLRRLPGRFDLTGTSDPAMPFELTPGRTFFAPSLSFFRGLSRA